MNQKLKYLSRIENEFDTVICGINGVFWDGNNTNSEGVQTLVKMYQSGKKIALASNTCLRVRNLYYMLKKYDVPMNIFYSMITAGEIAHFYLKNCHDFGESYFNILEEDSNVMQGLRYQQTDSIVMADFILAEAVNVNIGMDKIFPILEQALHLRLPMICIGNDTSVMNGRDVIVGVGAIAEKYAMMGGKIMSFGKPDVRVAAYLTEKIDDFKKDRCLVIGDCMATDIRMGNIFGSKTLLLMNGVHQLQNEVSQNLDDLSSNYGLHVDYCMENLLW